MSPAHPRLEEFLAWLSSDRRPPEMQQARRLRWRSLPGGTVNLRVRVSGETNAGEQHWFVRFAGHASPALGAQLTTEALAHEAAAAAGLAPALVQVDAANGVLVSAWWPGQAWRWRQARRGIDRFAALAARLHAIPVPAGLPALNPSKAARFLLADLPAGPRTASTLQGAAFRAMERALMPASPAPPTESAAAGITAPVLVHSDPHAGNILEAADGTLCLVDFEYAGSGAPVHDLAVFATSHDLSGPQRQTLLAAYAAAGGTHISTIALRHACGVADALWLAWTARVHGSEWPSVPRARRVAVRLAALS
ncbi:MAG: hypothetical protein RJB26_2274 [Pseudomonadota bacterium]